VGVRLSAVSYANGVQGWVKVEHQQLTAFDGRSEHARDLSSLTDQEMRAIEARFAAENMIVEGAPLRLLVSRQVNRQGQATLLFRETSGTQRWARLNATTRRLVLFDGVRLRRQHLPSPALVPPDLDQYNRSVLRYLDEQNKSAYRATQGVVGDDVSNGASCGSDSCGGASWVPDGDWGDACVAHDDCYSNGSGGYGSYSRLDCDNLLFMGMANSSVLGALLAPVYWLGVRLFGSSCYNSANRNQSADEPDDCSDFGDCFDPDVSDPDDGYGGDDYGGS
jgi:hypothetical protein